MLKLALQIEQALKVKALKRLSSLCKHLSQNSEKTTFQQFDPPCKKRALRLEIYLTSTPGSYISLLLIAIAFQITISQSLACFLYCFPTCKHLSTLIKRSTNTASLT